MSTGDQAVAQSQDGGYAFIPGDPKRKSTSNGPPQTPDGPPPPSSTTGGSRSRSRSRSGSTTGSHVKRRSRSASKSGGTGGSKRGSRVVRKSSRPPSTALPAAPFAAGAGAGAAVTAAAAVAPPSQVDELLEVLAEEAQDLDDDGEEPDEETKRMSALMVEKPVKPGAEGPFYLRTVTAPVGPAAVQAIAVPIWALMAAGGALFFIIVLSVVLTLPEIISCHEDDVKYFVKQVDPPGLALVEPSMLCLAQRDRMIRVESAPATLHGWTRGEDGGEPRAAEDGGPIEGTFIAYNVNSSTGEPLEWWPECEADNPGVCGQAQLYFDTGISFNPDTACGDNTCASQLHSLVEANTPGGEPLRDFRLSECAPVPVRKQHVEACRVATVTLPQTVNHSEIFQPSLIVQQFEPRGSHATATVDQFKANGCFVQTVEHLILVPPPTVVDLSPPAICRGTTHSVTLTGRHFLVTAKAGDTGPTLAHVESLGADDTTPFNVTDANKQFNGCSSFAVPRYDQAENCSTLSLSLTAADFPSPVQSIAITNPAPADCQSVEIVQFRVLERPVIERAEPPIVCVHYGPRTVTLFGSNFYIIDGEDSTIVVHNSGNDSNAEELELEIVNFGDCTELPFADAAVGRHTVLSCTQVTVVVPQSLDPGDNNGATTFFLSLSITPLAKSSSHPLTDCQEFNNVALAIAPRPQAHDILPPVVCHDTARQFLLDGKHLFEYDAVVPIGHILSLPGPASNSAADLASRRLFPAVNVVPVNQSCSSVALSSSPFTADECTELQLQLTPAESSAWPEGGLMELAWSNPDPLGCYSDLSQAPQIRVLAVPVIERVSPPAICRTERSRTITVLGPSVFHVVDGALTAITVDGQAIAPVLDTANCTQLPMRNHTVEACASFSVELPAKTQAALLASVVTVTPPGLPECQQQAVNVLYEVPQPVIDGHQLAADLLCANTVSNVVLSGQYFSVLSAQPPTVLLNNQTVATVVPGNCSEIGSLGPAFQLCQNLTLVDVLPLNGVNNVTLINPLPIGCETSYQFHATVVAEMSVVSAAPPLVCLDAAPQTAVVFTGNFYRLNATATVTVDSSANVVVVPSSSFSFANCAQFQGPTGVVFEQCTELSVTLDASFISAAVRANATQPLYPSLAIAMPELACAFDSGPLLGVFSAVPAPRVDDGPGFGATAPAVCSTGTQTIRWSPAAFILAANCVSPSSCAQKPQVIRDQGQASQLILDPSAVQVNGCDQIDVPGSFYSCSEIAIDVPVDGLSVSFDLLVTTVLSPGPPGTVSGPPLYLLTRPDLTNVEPNQLCTGMGSGDQTLQLTGSFLELDGALPQVSVNGSLIATRTPTACAQPQPLGALSSRLCSNIDVVVPESVAAMVALGAVDVEVRLTDQCLDRQTGALIATPVPQLASSTPARICIASTNSLSLSTPLGVPQSAFASLTPGNPLTVSARVAGAATAAVTDTTVTLTDTTVIDSTLTVGYSLNGVNIAVNQLDANLVDDDSPLLVEVYNNGAPDGCMGSSAEVAVVAPKPLPSAIVPSQICFDQSYTLNLTGTRFSSSLADVQLIYGGMLGVFGCQLCVGDRWSSQSPFLPSSTAQANVYGHQAAANNTLIELSIRGADTDNETPLTPGLYTVEVTNLLDSDLGCRTAMTAPQLRVHPKLLVFFVSPSLVFNGISVQLTVYATGLLEKLDRIVFTHASGVAFGQYTFQSNETEHETDNFNKIFVTFPSGALPGDYDVQLFSTIGCQTLSNRVVEVTNQTTIALASPAPSHVYFDEPTGVVLSVKLPANATYSQHCAVTDIDCFEETPTVYLSPASDDGLRAQQLTAASYVNQGTLTALITGVAVGNYTVVVLNPGGEVGVLEGGLQVLDHRPLEIDAITPNILENDAQTVVIKGRYLPSFQQATATVSCVPAADPVGAIATTLSVIPTADSGEGDLLNTRLTIGSVTLPISNLCTVTVKSLSDGAEFTWASLGRTNPSSNLQYDFRSSPQSLKQQRRGPVAVPIRVTSADKRILVAGGDNAASGGAAFGSVAPLASIEASKIERDGTLTGFEPLRSQLATATAFGCMVRVQSYVVLVGGHDGSQALNSVQTAQVLSSRDAPILSVDINVDPRSSLPAFPEGLYIYQVSAVFGAGDTANPGGESLPSEALSLRLPANITGLRVQVSWPAVNGASGYYVYRTPLPGQSVKQAVLRFVLAGNGNTTYVDDNQFSYNGTDPSGRNTHGTPLPLGELSQWRTVPGASLTSGRYGLGCAAVPARASNQYTLVTYGGLNSAGTGGREIHYSTLTIGPSPASGTRETLSVGSLTLYSATGMPQPVAFSQAIVVGPDNYAPFAGGCGVGGDADCYKIMSMQGVGVSREQVVQINLDSTSQAAVASVDVNGKTGSPIYEDHSACVLYTAGQFWWFAGSPGLSFPTAPFTDEDYQQNSVAAGDYTSYPASIFDPQGSLQGAGSVTVAPQSYQACVVENANLFLIGGITTTATGGVTSNIQQIAPL